MGIRFKIMVGFIILASMLFISGAISIYEITKMGKDVNELVMESYRSIEYSKNMLDALDNQKIAFLYLVNGDSETANNRFNAAHDYFSQNLNMAIGSFYLTQEQVLIDSVRVCYEKYGVKSKPFLRESSIDLAIYLEEIDPYIAETAEHVKNLVLIYQEALFKSTAYLENSTHRAIMPGLLVILISLIFTFMFTYLVNHFFAKPIVRLTKGIDDFVKYKKPFDVRIETRDELLSLKESIVSLIYSQRSTLQSKEK